VVIKVIDNWTSENKKLNALIRETQTQVDVRVTRRSGSREYRSSIVYDVMRWIPYERFKDIQQIGKGGFAIVYKATWLDYPGDDVYYPIDGLDDDVHKKMWSPIARCYV